MPRRKGEKISYTEETMLSAVASIKNGTMSYRVASRTYGVPIATLCDKIKNRVPLAIVRPGRHTVLSPTIEKRILDYMLVSSKIGYAITRNEIPNVVKNFIDKMVADNLVVFPAGNNFENNKPSKNWVTRFLDRNPCLATRTAENLGFQRAVITKERLLLWFEDLKTYLFSEHSLDATEFLSEENASRIFNLDESGFALQGTNSRLKVVALKGCKNVHRLGSDNKEQITVLACVSAKDEFLKPLVIFPGVRDPKPNFSGVNSDDFDIGKSKNGWMTSEVFFTWLSSIFYPSVKDTVQFPIIIFLDGHSSHYTLPVSDFCRDHDIIVYLLPPHASHILQPLDVSVFGPLKKKWNESINTFKETFHVAVTRSNFLQVFDPAWKSVTVGSTKAKAGFRTCGLVPFDPSAVKYEKLLDRKALENYSSSKESVGTTSVAERLGMLRMFSLFKSCLSDDILKNFEVAYAGGSRQRDEITSQGMLYRFFAEGNDILKKSSYDTEITTSENIVRVGSLNTTNDSNCNENVVLNINSSVNIDLSTDPLAVTEESFSAHLDQFPSGIFEEVDLPSVELEENNIQIQEMSEVPVLPTSPSVNLLNNYNSLPSTSTPSSSNFNRSYQNFEKSPFKKYFRISDNMLPVQKKSSKRKLNLQNPSALTSKDLNNHLHKKISEKEEKMKQIAKRKEDRENKRLAKTNCKSNKTLDMEVIYYDSYDDDMENICSACGGDDVEVPSDSDGESEEVVWVGCSCCPRWFHKVCLNLKVTLSELEDYKCKVCVGLSNKRQSKRNSQK